MAVFLDDLIEWYLTYDYVNLALLALGLALFLDWRTL